MPIIFHIFANAALGKGLSGSDRIFIEISKRLCKRLKVYIHVWEEGYQMCLSQGLNTSDDIKFNVINVSFWCRFGFTVCYLARIILAVKEALFLKIPPEKQVVFYSASEFWMDSLPAFILKIRFPKSVWVAAWFQTAPNPLTGFTKGDRQTTYKLAAFYYWLMQFPMKPLIGKFADLVLVNNEGERAQFPKMNIENRVVVMLGAINFKEIENWIHLHGLGKDKTYDAVFQGRFHPQKGVVELIEIWKLVVERLPQAKLAMIGDGPLMNDVRAKIESSSLSHNVKLFGYIFDGPEKYGIFASSKIVVHPAFYDSGGMAAAEAMAFGLPCVGFDLDSYKSYYPKGMVKVRIGDLKGFADKIVELIRNLEIRNQIGEEAQKMIKKNWSWEQRTNLLIVRIEELIAKRS